MQDVGQVSPRNICMEVIFDICPPVTLDPLSPIKPQPEADSSLASVSPAMQLLQAGLLLSCAVLTVHAAGRASSCSHPSVQPDHSPILPRCCLRRQQDQEDCHPEGRGVRQLLHIRSRNRLQEQCQVSGCFQGELDQQSSPESNHHIVLSEPGGTSAS